MKLFKILPCIFVLLCRPIHTISIPTPQSMLPVGAFVAMAIREGWTYYDSKIPHMAHQLKHAKNNKNLDINNWPEPAQKTHKTLSNSQKPSSGLEQLKQKAISARTRLWISSALKLIGYLAGTSCAQHFLKGDDSWLSGIKITVSGFLSAYAIIELINGSIDYAYFRLTGNPERTLPFDYTAIIQSVELNETELNCLASDTSSNRKH